MSSNSALPRHRSGCVYLQVEARFALAVCGELYEVSCTLVLLPFSCPLLMLQMGKVEPGVMLSNLEAEIKEQLADQPP